MKKLWLMVSLIAGFVNAAQALEVLIDEPNVPTENEVITEDMAPEKTEKQAPQLQAENETSAEQIAPENDDLSAADVVKLEALINEGFDVNERDENGITPLVYVLRNNADLTVAQKLIDAGADVNAPCLDGTTPLLTAVSVAQDMDNDYQQILDQTHSSKTETYQGRFNQAAEIQMQRAQKMLQLLIVAGADVNQETPRGTPLMAAAANARNTMLIEMLLQSGAHVNQTDQRGRTALFYAHAFGNEDIETQLIRAGASTDIRDRSGLIYMDAQKADFLPREAED
jgi:ankyrin repeat protein